MKWLLPHGPYQGHGLLNRFRWAYLLVVLLAGFLVEPVFGSTRNVSLLGLFLYVIVFVGMVRLSHLPRRLELLCYGVIAVWSALSIGDHFYPDHAKSGALLTLSVVISAGALVITFTELMRPDVLTIDKLFGAIVGYFMIALVLALLYFQIELLTPGSFSMPNEDVNAADFLYFSLVTLTTLGYGDITPVSQMARMLAGLQAATGTLFIAILIGQIVGSIKR
ncbi:hypothetical protein KHP62_15210 [Rhodobacteraceae bacterium NNCM2]|nr:hypothetical protein [Coraliihabitans acroporae]